MPRPGPRRDLVCVRMSAEQIAALDAAAARDDTDRSEIVRRAVDEYVIKARLRNQGAVKP